MNKNSCLFLFIFVCLTSMCRVSSARTSQQCLSFWLSLLIPVLLTSSLGRLVSYCYILLSLLPSVMTCKLSKLSFLIIYPSQIFQLSLSVQFLFMCPFFFCFFLYIPPLIRKQIKIKQLTNTIDEKYSKLTKNLKLKKLSFKNLCKTKF